MDAYTNDGRKLLENWFRKAAPWQKDLFVQIWNDGLQADEIQKRAIKLIEQEYLSENHRVAAVTDFPKDITVRDQGNKLVKLTQISDIKGIGALAPRKPLTFGDGLTVVYGQNGCGKSSYVRILKALANPANGTAVFGNVYQKNPEEPEATAVFTEDGIERRVTWTKTFNDKQPIQIYDTIEADRLVNKENEVIYEPKVLPVITQMAAMYDRLSDHFSQLTADTERQIPKLPQELAFHPITAEFSDLTSQAGLNAFVKKYPWTDAEKEELERIEVGLRESAPEQAANAKTAQRELIRSQGFNILKMLPLVSDEARSDILVKRARQIETKKAADMLVADSTKQSLLKKFGDDTWKMMWLRATEYVSAAEGNADMPVTESGRCALCQQELDTEAMERMKRFQEFVRSSAITEADMAYQDFKATVRSLQENVENKVNLSELKTVLESGAVSPDIRDDIISLYEAI